MPWCDECSKFWTPGSLPATGTCPTCGRALQTGSVATARRGRAGSAAADEAGPDADYKAPWHFKLMVALAVVYLGWRLIQLITWLV